MEKENYTLIEDERDIEEVSPKQENDKNESKIGSYLILSLQIFVIPVIINSVVYLFPYDFHFNHLHPHPHNETLHTSHEHHEVIVPSASFFSITFHNVFFYCYCHLLWLIIYDYVIPGFNVIIVIIVIIINYIIITSVGLPIYFSEALKDDCHTFNPNMSFVENALQYIFIVVYAGVLSGVDFWKRCKYGVVDTRPRKRWSDYLMKFVCCKFSSEPVKRVNGDYSVNSGERSVKKDVRESIKPFLRACAMVVYKLGSFMPWYVLTSFSEFWITGLRESKYSVFMIILFHLFEIMTEMLMNIIVFLFIPTKDIPEMKHYHIFFVILYFNLFHRFLFIEITTLQNFFIMSVIWFVYFYIKFPFRTTKHYYKFICRFREILFTAIGLKKYFPKRYHHLKEEYTYEEHIEDIAIEYYFEEISKYISLFYFIVVTPICRYLPYNNIFFPIFYELDDDKFGWLLYIEFLTDMAFQLLMFKTCKVHMFEKGKNLTTDKPNFRFLCCINTVHLLNAIILASRAPYVNINKGGIF